MLPPCLHNVLSIISATASVISVALDLLKFCTSQLHSLHSQVDAARAASHDLLATLNNNKESLATDEKSLTNHDPQRMTSRIMSRALIPPHDHSHNMDVILDMGHPFLNKSVDSFLKLGAVGATRVASEYVFGNLKKETPRKHNFRRKTVKIMPRARVSTHVQSPSVDVIVDMGHPFLNRTVDGFLKIGMVGAAHAASQEIFSNLKKERVSKHDLERMVKRMGKDGVQWGVVAGVYTGMEYGMERVRGKRDWKNALLGGALTGALLTLGEKSYNRDKMIEGAITGGAIATASEFLRYLT